MESFDRSDTSVILSSHQGLEPIEPDAGATVVKDATGRRA